MPFSDVAVSKEFSFLCACVGVELSAERIARLAHWNDAGIDWPEFLLLAEYHGVLPLVARNLAAHAQGLPADVDQSLRSEFAKNLRRNLWFASELIRILEYFEQNDLRAIPYKGPVLAESAYGDVALRNFGDLDFLISSSSFERAKQALGELGYHPSKPLSLAVERYWLRNGYECSFDGAAGKYLIELQWGLLPHFYAVHLRTDDLLVRSRSTMFSGREVAALSPEDSLLVLCLHAAKHLWMRMIWVCDIAETIRTQVLDWNVIRSRARELGILRIVGVSFWLSQRLLGCVLPDAANEVVNQDQEVAALGKQFATRLAASATYDFESTEYFRLILRLRERRSDQARYLWRLLWTPGEGDLAAIRFPEAMFPLYRGVRALRLLGKLF
jgi:hypothetical protein